MSNELTVRELQDAIDALLAGLAYCDDVLHDKEQLRAFKPGVVLNDHKNILTAVDILQNAAWKMRGII